MATAGLCTYPLFLIHQHIGFMLFNSYGVGENKYVLLVITLWLMLLLSFVIVKYIEPCLSKGLSIIIRRPWFLKSGHAQQLA
jgi:peptidoglycan/LPS O-acetylase OafA/YrhL